MAALQVKEYSNASKVNLTARMKTNRQKALSLSHIRLSELSAKGAAHFRVGPPTLNNIIKKEGPSLECSIFCVLDDSRSNQTVSHN